jgi:hypothetical protein
MGDWRARIAEQMGIKHSDTIAVVKYGKDAKRATRRRQRRLSKKEVTKYESSENVQS